MISNASTINRLCINHAALSLFLVRNVVTHSGTLTTTPIDSMVNGLKVLVDSHCNRGAEESTLHFGTLASLELGQTSPDLIPMGSISWRPRLHSADHRLAYTDYIIPSPLFPLFDFYPYILVTIYLFFRCGHC